MILNESFKTEDIIPRADKPCELFLGRMQPVHNGHAKIIHSMKNGFVAIVKGAESSKDRARNPLPYEYQARLVKMIAPQVKILMAPTGYLPEIINLIREKGFEVGLVYAGADRIEGYKAQVARANKGLDADRAIKVDFQETERVTSATVVREAIRDNKLSVFKKNVPKEIWGEFQHLQGLILMESRMVKTFEEFLQEESNVSAGSEQSEKPMGKKGEKGDDEEE